MAVFTLQLGQLKRDSNSLPAHHVENWAEQVLLIILTRDVCSQAEQMMWDLEWSIYNIEAGYVR